MEVRQRIWEILGDERLDREGSAQSKAEAIESLIRLFGWEPVREFMMEVLRDDHQEPHWRIAADVFWGAVLDKRRLAADELIALLYLRFGPDGRAEDNEVWSIASKLKGVGYLSKYEPLLDPAVAEELQKIRGRGGSRMN
jgi:hypothetical protein